MAGSEHWKQGGVQGVQRKQGMRSVHGRKKPELFWWVHMATWVSLVPVLVQQCLYLPTFNN